MADKVPEKRMRVELQHLLKGADLEALKLGPLRAELEKRLSLSSGALDGRKDEVKQIIQSELVDELTRRQSAEQDSEPAKKKQKKDKKEKDKKEKKEKKDKKSSDEGEPAQAQPETAAATQVDAAPPGVEASAEVVPAAEVAVVAPAADTANAVATVTAEAGKEAAAVALAELGGTDLVASPQKAIVPRARSWALTGSEDSCLRLWDLESQSCARVFEGHTGTVRDIAADWEQMQAISAAEDGARLWDLRHGGCQKSFAAVAAKVGEEAGCGAVCANWKSMTALGGCGDGSLRLWDLTTGEVNNKVVAHAGGVWALEAHWESKRAVSGGDEQFKIWALGDLSCMSKIDAGQPGGIMCLTVEWDGSRLLVGTGGTGEHHNLRVWDTENRKPASLIGHRDAVAHIRADWSNDVAVSGGWDALLKVWDLESKVVKQSIDVPFGRVRSLAVDFAQNQVACGSSSGTLHLLDLHTGTVQRSLDGHVGGVTAVKVQF